MFKKLSRNALCWCDSKKKYKNCHHEQDEKLHIYKKQGYQIPPRYLIKTSEQIAGIRQSCQLTKKILDLVTPKIKEGLTTDEINTFIHETTLKHNAIPAPLGYRGFPKSCCTSLNNVICHGIPDKTKLKSGDILNVDVTCILNGYYGDASRMVEIGKTTSAAKKLIQVAKKCLDLGIQAVSPYRGTSEIGRAIESYAQKFDFSVVRDFGGHGLGTEFHADPFIFHYARSEPGMLMLPNMVFTIEPMINAGSYKCKILEDKWTTITVDNSLSAQWEHTLCVTETGVDILTA
jgi:methionyl aminopeptidase